MFQGQHLKYSVLTSPPDLDKSHPIKKKKNNNAQRKYQICCLRLLNLQPNASKKNNSQGDFVEKNNLPNS